MRIADCSGRLGRSDSSARSAWYCSNGIAGSVALSRTASNVAGSRSDRDVPQGLDSLGVADHRLAIEETLRDRDSHQQPPPGLLKALVPCLVGPVGSPHADL